MMPIKLLLLLRYSRSIRILYKRSYPINMCHEVNQGPQTSILYTSYINRNTYGFIISRLLSSRVSMNNECEFFLLDRRAIGKHLITPSYLSLSCQNPSYALKVSSFGGNVT